MANTIHRIKIPQGTCAIIISLAGERTVADGQDIGESLRISQPVVIRFLAESLVAPQETQPFSRKMFPAR